MKRQPRPSLIETLHPLQRRGFMKLLGVALAIPGVPLGVRYAARALALGEAKAEELESPPINFIEINLRDQWDFGQVFVAPLKPGRYRFFGEFHPATAQGRIVAK